MADPVDPAGRAETPAEQAVTEATGVPTAEPTSPALPPLSPPPVEPEIQPIPPPGPAEAPPQRTRRTAIWLAVAAAVVAAAVILTFVLVRSSSSPAPADAQRGVALRLTFTAGNVAEYLQDRTIDGYILAPDGSRSAFVLLDHKAQLRTVVSVDQTGSAVLAVGDTTWGSLNGGTLPVADASDVVQGRVRLGADGTILEGGALPLPGQGLVAGTPATDLFQPVLPTGPVTPGQTWTRDYRRAYPFQGGTISYRTTNRYVRHTTILSVPASLLLSHGVAHFDVSLSVRDLTVLDPNLIPTHPDARFDLVGDVTYDTLGWIDAANGRVIQTQTDASLVMTVTSSDPTATSAPQVLTYSARLSEVSRRLTVDSVSPPPGPSASPTG